MTTFSMPKNLVVTVTQRDLSQFLSHVSQTVQHHINYTENDEVTEQAWKELVSNRINKARFHSVEDVALMLQVLNPKSMNLGDVISCLFEKVPVLERYYTITKVNAKSVKVKHIVINDMRKFLLQQRETVVAPVPATKQTMLTQDIPSLKPLQRWQDTTEMLRLHHAPILSHFRKKSFTGID